MILYADKITDSMRKSIDETGRRRAKQLAYNTEHGITPQTIRKEIQDILGSVYEMDYGHIPEIAEPVPMTKEGRHARMQELERLMLEAAADLRFEDAAAYRDELQRLNPGA